MERLLADPLSRVNHYGAMARVRAETPIYRTTTGVWLVTGHKAGWALMADPRMSRWESAKTEWIPRREDDPDLHALFDQDPELQRATETIALMLINRDGDDHQRLRKLVRHAFLPSAIKQWRDRIEEATDAIMKRVEGKREFDFLREVAFPLPEIVVCEMSGVPISDHVLWEQWASATVGAIRTPRPKGDNLRQALEGNLHFYRYFKDMIAKRRNNLGDDLISLFLRAQEEEETLSEDEVIATMIMLITAGHETTANLIGNGMYLLMKNPELYAELREHPEHIPNAVEEMLRVEGPAQFSAPRTAMDDIEIEGVTIRKGDIVIVARPAANRDPAVFPDPDRVDFGRTNLNQHQGFGAGPHSCLGRQLAQLEAQIMFREIMKRLPDLELVREPGFRPMTTRAFTELLVRRKSLAATPAG